MESCMKKFFAKFTREFEVDIEAVDMKTAERIVNAILEQFPKTPTGERTAKLLSIHVEGYVEPVVSVEPSKPQPPFGGNAGPSGGTPGAGTARQEILVDQIAVAA